MPARLGERLLHTPLRWIMLPAWLLWRPLVAWRNRQFDRGSRQARRASVPVISVGNIAVGGTGKTPLVAWICEFLLSQGRQPHVLSRGYKADASGHNEEAELVPVPVHCDPQRWRGAEEAVSAGADCCVLDDAFQHRQFARDCDIVCLDATKLWGFPGDRGGATASAFSTFLTLPLGFLREGPQALARAQVIILTRCDLVDDHQRLVDVVRPFTTAKVLLAYQQLSLPVRCYESYDNSDNTVTKILDQAQPWILVSGIGNPQAFARAVANQGQVIGDQQIFPDHHHYTVSEVQALESQARQQQAYLGCTEKDAIKIRRLLANPNNKLDATLWHFFPLRCHFEKADEQALKDIILEALGCEGSE